MTAAVEPVLNKQFIDQRPSAPQADITVEELTFYTVHSLYRPIVTEAWRAKKEYVVSHSQSITFFLYSTLYKVGFVLTGNFLYYTGEDQHKPERKNQQLVRVPAVILFDWFSMRERERQTERQRVRDRDTECVCERVGEHVCVHVSVCVCVCILDVKGSRVFACRPLIVVQMAM